MSARQVIGLIGSIILILGVFAPIVSIPIIGGVNYFKNGEGDGIYILILGLISMVLVLAKKYNRLWLTSIGTLTILSLTYYFFNQRMEQASANIKSELGNNPFAGIADAALQTIQLEWGMPLLLVGAFFLIGSAVMRDETEISNTQSVILPIGIPIIVLLLFLNFAYYSKKETDTSTSEITSNAEKLSGNIFGGEELIHNSKRDINPDGTKKVFIDEDAL